MNKEKHALKVAVVAVLTAVVVVFTLVVRIPTTKGYLNLCDVAICFIAFTFGPVSAFLAAGLGTAIADLISGYAQWAPISFIVHGIEGLLIALIVRKQPLSKMRILLAAIGCVLTVSLGYFVLSALFISTVAVAAAEIPPNMIQAGVGVVFGLALSKAIKRAYPPVSALSW
ncbi:MAG: Thiamine precursor transporter HmpT [Spirochaetes bacterium ADurb.Bin315]|nr:MAG: Thiamine precursor transporter HmpT [Spirochaetes bacterium ADurb.Bin315]HNZ94570.1 ECF transporter S component [Sphaerochaeta sp.]HPY46022.1 ECF transporter S component [Sphaerochaeta sp.]HQB06099.1 ECF transporter S component [Sphaerochaeta sp.]